MWEKNEMTQSEVQNILEKTHKEMSVVEIAKKLHKGRASITKNVKVLFEKNEIKRKVVREGNYFIPLYFM